MELRQNDGKQAVLVIEGTTTASQLFTEQRGGCVSWPCSSDRKHGPRGRLQSFTLLHTPTRFAEERAG